MTFATADAISLVSQCRYGRDVGNNFDMFSLCSGLNSKNNDFMRFLAKAMIAAMGVVVMMFGALVLSSGCDVLSALVSLVASGAGLIFMARAIDVVRAVFIDCLTPNCSPIAVLKDAHLIEAAAVISRNRVAQVTHELNEPSGGIRGLAKKDVPPPLLSV